MTRETIERWYTSLPEYERDMPLITVEGKSYTPNEVLREVRNGTALGEKLQEKVETGGLRERLEALAKERVTKLLEKRPAGIAWLAPPDWPKELSPEEIKEEVRKQSDIGRQFIEMEKSYMHRLMRG